MNFNKKIASIKKIHYHLQAHNCSKKSKAIGTSGPIISFCFDDFPVSAFENGLPVLNNYRVKATFYISLGLTGEMTHTGKIASYNMVSQLLSQDHEIGCHTFDHVNAWETPQGQYKESICRNKTLFQKEFPGFIMHTFAYPYGSATCKTKKIVEKYFECGRGTYWGVNAKTIDLNILKSCHLSCTRATVQDKFAIIKKEIDKTVKRKAWTLFYIHDVQDTPTDCGCPPDFLDMVIQTVFEYTIPVLPVHAAYEKIKDN